MALAGRSEGWAFAVVCILTLLLVTAADASAAGHQGSVGAMEFIPIVAAAWLLGRLQAIVVTMVAIVCRCVLGAAGLVPGLTVVADVGTIVALATLGQLAAEGLVGVRKTEAKLRQANEESGRFAVLEQRKADFLRLASHELRGPVAVVAGYFSMIADGTLGDLPEGIRKVLPVMRAKLSSMSVLIDEMLDAARLEDDRLELHLEAVDLRVLLGDAIEAIGPLAADDQVVRLVAGDDPVMAVVDRSRVGTILNNLIDNAIKYSPDGGEVVCSVAIERGLALASVRDHGVGIPPEQLPMLFQRFSRAVTPANASIPGTGLGLYLARQLARRHGGDLKVSSLPGEGSVFTLELPMATPPGTAPKAGQAPGSASSHGRRTDVRTRPALCGI